MTGPGPQSISDQELIEVLALIEAADSVELKLTVPEAAHRSAVAALDLDPLDAQIRQVFFFDTPDLALDRAGVVVRARRVQGKGDDTVVKLRPVDPAALPDSLRRLKGFGVEVDAMPGGYVCSGSLKARAGADVRTVASGEAPTSALLTAPQRELFAERAPDGVDIDELAVLGPIFVLKVKTVPPGYERKLVTELWLYPDDSKIVELSTKCLPSEAFQIAAETRAFLAGRGIGLDGEQQTKTRKALEFFSARLG